MEAAQAKAIRTLYRHLLRTVRAFDTTPALAALLTLHTSAAPPLLAAQVPLLSCIQPPVDLGGLENAEYAAVIAATSVVGSVLGAWLSPGRLFPATPATESGITLRQAITDTVRRRHGDSNLTAALSLYCAAQLLQHVTDVASPLLSRPENQPPLLSARHLAASGGGGAAAPAASPGGAFAGLQLSSTLRPPCLMVEHPSVLGPPGRAVLLVYDVSRNLPELHGDDAWTVRAYCVNRPFPRTVAAVTGRRDLGAFGQLSLFHGGADHGNLSVIHCHGDIPGAAAIDPEAAAAAGGDGGQRHLYVGGDVAAINARLAGGSVRPADLKVVLGATSFTLQQQQQHPPATGGGGGSGSVGVAEEPALELPDDDCWWLADGPGVADAALWPAEFDTVGLFRDGRGLGDEPVVGYNHARFWHQNALWGAAVRGLAAGQASAGAANVAGLHPAVAHAVAAQLPLRVSLPPLLRTLFQRELAALAQPLR